MKTHLKKIKTDQIYFLIIDVIKNTFSYYFLNNVFSHINFFFLYMLHVPGLFLYRSLLLFIEEKSLIGKKLRFIKRKKDR